MIDVQKIESLVNEAIRETEIFVVEVSVKQNNRISVFVDHPIGLSVDECVRISRHIEGNLDREVEDFELEVSSPGADQPFVKLEQYKKNIGQIVRIVRKDGHTFEGTLKMDSDEAVSLHWEEKVKDEKKKKKVIVEKQETINFQDVASAKRIIRF